MKNIMNNNNEIGIKKNMNIKYVWVNQKLLIRMLTLYKVRKKEYDIP